jgi:TonB-linked SusC/RagA family outer membrane protein
MHKRWHVRALVATLLVLAPVVLGAQDRQISGRVTSSTTGQPLENAVISIVGSNRVASRADAQGRYSIVAPSGDLRLRFRALGHAMREVLVPASQSSVDIQLSRDAFRLADVVVTGQATTVERRSATTASAYVAGEDVTKVSAPTFENALTGKVTGVNIQSNSGAPGGGIQLQIRGNNTILGAFDPLYVVDGVIYSNERIAGGRAQITNAAFATAEDDAVNRVADINPADIASLEILKGAAASSIYGSKAANGVVIITTRRGRAGEPRMNLVQRVGQFQPTRTLEARKYTQADAVARYGAGVAHWFTPNANPYFNHYDDIFTNSELSHETLLDVSGGSENTRYFVGGGWRSDDGIEINTGFTRGSLRANIDQTLHRRLDVQVSSVFNRSSHDRGWNNNCNNYACHGYAFPYTPSFVDYNKRDAQGNYIVPDWGIQSNTKQLSELAVNHEETSRFTGGATLSFNALQNDRHMLRLVAGGGIDAFGQNNDLWSPNELFHERPQALPGEAIEQNGLSRYLNWNLNGVHTLTASGWSATTSAGLQYEDRKLNVSRIRTQNLVPGQRNVGQGTNTTATETLTQERTIALYGQEEVRLLNDRLLAQLALRAERSSVNGDIEKYYIFPKVAASYRFPDVLGMGIEVKPRAAYGETGNQPVFGQKFTLLGTPQLGGLQGFTVAGASGSPTVAPERVKEVELGLDGSAMDGALTWELTHFTRNTTNLLLQRVPAPSTGFTSQIFNGGKIQNSGVEVGLGYTAISNSTTEWITRMTFTRYRNKVEDLEGLPAFRPPLSGFGGLGVTFVEVGEPMTQLIGRGFCEDFPNETCDTNGIRTTRTDLTIGNTAPDFRMGFVNDVTWKAVTFSAVLDYQHGGDIINLTQYLYDDAQNAADFGSPEYTARRRGYSNSVMSPYIEDATFLKLREVNIAYDLRQHQPGRAQPDVLAEIQRTRPRGREPRLRGGAQQPRRRAVSAKSQLLPQLRGGVLTMTLTTRHFSAVVIALLLTSCKDLDVTNTNAPTSDALAGAPTQAVLARAAIGIQTQAFNDVATMIEFFAIYGREGYNLLGNDPRETGEQIAGPQEAGGRAGGHWLGQYQAIRSINTYLAGVAAATDLTPAQKSASSGFAKTYKAWSIYRLAVRSGTTGIPIDVDRPITADPAPFVSFIAAMQAASTLMDEANTDLAAGGTAFPFTFVPGYTGFTTPAAFATFNRALAAKILVHRATFNACTACWAQANTAINASFITTAGLPGSLTTGVYYGYTGAAGELSNPVTETLTNNRYWIHPSILTGAQLTAGGAPDLRLTNKTLAAGRTHTLNGISATHKPVLFNNATNRANTNTDADIPWIKNEELLLLRAEIRWNTANLVGALADIDLVRTNSGGLPPTTLTVASPTTDFVTELLYNRTYSLLWEQGTRWIDARRYGRLTSLPLDRAGDVRHSQMLVPAGECDARKLPVPCTP